jgi:hypothetical protein
VSKWLTALAAVVVVGAVTATGLLLRGSASTPAAQADVRTLPDGPIRNLPEHGYILEDSSRGRTFTDGMESLELRGNEPATIDSIQLSGDSVFTTIGLLLAGPDRANGRTQRFERFPPTADVLGELAPAVGAVLHPTASAGGTGDYELLIGTKVTSDGIGMRRGIWIKYHVGNHYYSEHLLARVIFCPSGRTWQSCSREVGVRLQ